MRQEDSLEDTPSPGSAARPRCVLVLGAPRTGTTLIATALGAHPSIAMLDEDLHGAVERIIGGKLPGVKLCVPNQVQWDSRWRELYRIARMSRGIRRRYRHIMPLSRWSLKDYEEAFDCVFICIIRDPLRSVQSISRRENVPTGTAVRFLCHAYALFRDLNKNRTHSTAIISFDRFLLEPELECQRLCRLIGIDYDEAMLHAPTLNKRYPMKDFNAEKATAKNGVTSHVPDSSARSDSGRLRPKMEFLIEQSEFTELSEHYEALSINAHGDTEVHRDGR